MKILYHFISNNKIHNKKETFCQHKMTVSPNIITFPIGFNDNQECKHA